MNSDRLTGISQAKTIEEIAEYWDAHDLDQHWDDTKQAVFEVRAERQRRVTLAPEIYTKIEAKAKSSGLLPETLVNLWLAELLTKEKAA